MDITLRPVEAADVSFLREVFACIQQNLAPLGRSAERLAALLGMQYRAQHAAYLAYSPHTTFYLILIDGKPVGRFYVARLPDEIRLLDVVVMPMYRNQGIGAVLLLQLIGEAMQVGKPVRLYVEKMNHAARRLYERLGWVGVADDGAHWLMEWSA